MDGFVSAGKESRGVGEGQVVVPFALIKNHRGLSGPSAMQGRGPVKLTNCAEIPPYGILQR